MRLSPGGKGGDFLVTNVQPVDSAMTAQRICDSIKAIAHDPVDAPNASCGKGFNQLVGNGFGHDLVL